MLKNERTLAVWSVDTSENRPRRLSLLYYQGSVGIVPFLGVSAVPWGVSLAESSRDAWDASRYALFSIQARAFAHLVVCIGCAHASRRAPFLRCALTKPTSESNYTLGLELLINNIFFVVAAATNISCRNLQNLTGFSLDFANFWKFCDFWKLSVISRNSDKIPRKSRRKLTDLRRFQQHLAKISKNYQHFANVGEKLQFWI